MRNADKRSRREDSSSPSSSLINRRSKHGRHHHISVSDHANRHRSSSDRAIVKYSNFNSHSDVSSSLSRKVKILCDIIAQTPVINVETVLDDTGMHVSEEDVAEVLKLSYGFPGSAVKFFRWSSFQLNHEHSSYSWNLVVDLLGKNYLFDAMWDAIKSMRKEQLLSFATFKSVFHSYAASKRAKEAILSFEVMDQYGVPKDILALNSLLHALCMEGQTHKAEDYLVSVKDKIWLDADTYAILLEGWESDGNVGRANQTFSNMLVDIGWDIRNTRAYDSFLCCRLKGSEGFDEVFMFFNELIERSCYPGMRFFKCAIDECVRRSDSKGSKVVWEALVGKNICRPDTAMYKSLISLYCNVKDFDAAVKLLDEMVYNGAFPDSETYGLLFNYMIKHKRIREAAPIFKEMVKNDFVPKLQDLSTAVKTYTEAGDPHMGVKVWRCMIESYKTDLDETGNFLVLGLRDMNCVPEAVRCAEDMIERGIKLNSSTLSKLKQSLLKVGKDSAYEELLHKWKGH